MQRFSTLFVSSAIIFGFAIFYGWPVAAQTPATEKTAVQRIQDRKDALKTRLDSATELRLKAKCKASQGLVTSVGTRSNTSLDNRQKRYAKVIERLITLEANLREKGLQTTSLKALIAALQTQVTDFNGAAATFSQTISDLKSMDCVADPAGFRATLETARAQRIELAKQATNVKAQIKKIREELTTLRQAQADQNDSTQTQQGAQ